VAPAAQRKRTPALRGSGFADRLTGVGRDEELAEFRTLSARVAAGDAGEAEVQRWRELRNQLAGPPPPPARTPPAKPRAHARVARKIRILYQPVKAMSVTFTEEVSAGGLRLNVNEMLEVGAALLVRIELSGPGDPEAVTSLARVAWCKREGGHFVAGVELVGLQPHERERLEANAHASREATAEGAEAPAPLTPPPSGFFAPPAAEVPAAPGPRPAAPPPAATATAPPPAAPSGQLADEPTTSPDAAPKVHAWE
jgi:hypothetical protein